MKTTSLDLRERILAAYDADEGAREEIAWRFRVSLGLVKKLLQQRRHTGEIGPRHHRSGRKPLLLEHHRQRLRRLVAEKPDRPLQQLREALGLACTLPTIHYALAALGLTFKKTLRAAEQDRPDIVRARRRWRHRQGGWDPARLVFLDEAAAKTNMTRLYGRAPRGERLLAKSPHGHWRTTTMISSIRLDGTTECMTVESATDTDVFRAYVREILCPALRPGDVVVMDNLSPHKNDRTLALIRAVGASVEFLPAYSPDLNPIELMWSKVKASLRATEARTAPDLLTAIGQALRRVTPRDAVHWFARCGYSFI
jgi:transposase